MTAPRDAQELLVGTLNLLPAAFNPFEYISADPSFVADYKLLERRAQSITWDDVLATCGPELLKLVAEVAPAYDQFREHLFLKGRHLWSFFSEDDHGVLKNANKLLSPRINLLVFAMRPHGAASGQWLLLESWRAALRDVAASADAESPYAADPNLLLWDLACNVLVSLEATAYRAICSSSYLNPNNFAALGRRILAQAEAAAARGLPAGAAPRPLLLGVQEWPEEGTAKGAALRAAAAEAGLGVQAGAADAAGVALLYSAKALGEPEVLDVAAEAPTLMQECIDAAAADGDTFDAAALKGLKTVTARRVLLVRFRRGAPGATRFVVMHAKEPKTDATAKVLARFATAIAAAPSLGGAPIDSMESALVAMVDTNLGSEALARTFGEALRARVYEALPAPRVPTTAKALSVLHGACHDLTRCLQVRRRRWHHRRRRAAKRRRRRGPPAGRAAAWPTGRRASRG